MRKEVAMLFVSFALTSSSAWAQKDIPPAPSGSASKQGEVPMDEQLMLTINNGCNQDLVELKLFKGADPNYKNADSKLGVKVGDNALVAALRRPCSEKVIKRFVKGEVPYIINMMQVKKADIETAGVDGATPLVLAVKLDDVSIVKMILEAGADPNRKMVSSDPALNGKTAFDFLDGKKHEKRLRKALKKERD